MQFLPSMAFPHNMAVAARRNLAAAGVLFEESATWGAAGYLFGIAAECAIKAIMEANGQHLTYVFWEHFPDPRSS